MVHLCVYFGCCYFSVELWYFEQNTKSYTFYIQRVHFEWAKCHYIFTIGFYLSFEWYTSWKFFTFVENTSLNWILASKLASKLECYSIRAMKTCWDFELNWRAKINSMKRILFFFWIETSNFGSVLLDYVHKLYENVLNTQNCEKWMFNTEKIAINCVENRRLLLRVYIFGQLWKYLTEISIFNLFKIVINKWKLEWTMNIVQCR